MKLISNVTHFIIRTLKQKKIHRDNFEFFNFRTIHTQSQCFDGVGHVDGQRRLMLRGRRRRDRRRGRRRRRDRRCRGPRRRWPFPPFVLGEINTNNYLFKCSEDKNIHLLGHVRAKWPRLPQLRHSIMKKYSFADHLIQTRICFNKKTQKLTFPGFRGLSAAAAFPIG